MSCPVSFGEERNQGSPPGESKAHCWNDMAHGWPCLEIEAK